MAVPMTLQVMKGDTLVAEKDFDRDIIKIGRLSSAHLCLDDEKVSRIHSVIESGADGSLSIIDMGSVEGTFVNGKRVNKGALAFGDEIRVGSTLIRLMRPGAQAEALQAAASVPVEVPSEAPIAAAPVQFVPVAPPAPPAVEFEAPEPQEERTELGLRPLDGDIVHQPAARVRPTTQAGSGPQGLELRLYWGDQMVASHFLDPAGKKKGFSVGSTPSVDFIMGERNLPGPDFEVARADGNGFTVRFTKRMTGEYTQGEKTVDLAALIASGKATSDGDAYALNIGPDGFLTVDLGGVTLEAFLNSRPKPVFVPFLETLDFGFLNVLLVMLILYALFIVTAITRTEDGDGFDDELNSNKARIAKLIIKPAEVQKTNPLLARLEQQKERAQANAASKGGEGKAGSKSKTASKKPVKDAPVGKPDVKDRARDVVADLFGSRGSAATLGGNVGIGGELQRAIGGVTGSSSGIQAGFGGLGLKGTGSGGGGKGDLAVIGGIGTKGRGSGDSEYGTNSGKLGGKRSTEVSITSSNPIVQGSLDPALIRAVIRAHHGQVKYCYESQLNTNPNLAGTVKIKFVISGNGGVTTASVDHTTMRNAAVEQCLVGRVRTWQFPKPKGGGVVIVAYPFTFKSAGG